MRGAVIVVLRPCHVRSRAWTLSRCQVTCTSACCLVQASSPVSPRDVGSLAGLQQLLLIREQRNLATLAQVREK